MPPVYPATSPSTVPMMKAMMTGRMPMTSDSLPP
jgi:hypothetical protein